MDTNIQRPNPYVGPRAYQTGEALYGRDREILNLYYLVLSERIVLLHSPSGAGKTSLIQAGLIPRLKEKFSYIPIIRVNHEPNEQISKIQGFNRYIFSAVASMDELQPDEKRLPSEELASLSLSDYLSLRAHEDQPQNGSEKLYFEALIFDQFEEIITIAPNDYLAKEQFFEQVGEALKDNKRWALFSAREDYVAAFEPYVRSIPSRFANRFRLDLLNIEMAMQPIQKPAMAAGVEFSDEAARKLIEDLSLVKVQRPDGISEFKPGRYVEPLQLQVVCYRLWNELSPDVTVIGENHLTTIESVNDSLAAYYSDQVNVATKQFNIPERIIREWFNNHLITSQGIRSQVIFEPGKSGGLENNAIQFFVASHLVRAEKRAGSTWFELSHDRLIEPIRLDNTRWLEANLVLFQHQADLWEKQDHPESLLLRGKDLALASAWSAEHKTELLAYEVEFLAACKDEEARAKRLRRRNQVISVLGVVAMVLAVIAMLAYRQADIQRSEAQRQERVARAGQLAAQSHNSLDEFPQRSILLALEALKTTQRFFEPAQAAAEEALRSALDEPRGQPLGRQDKPVTVVAFSPISNPKTGGGWLAVGSEDGSILLWDRHDENKVTGPTRLTLDGSAVRALAISPDENWLAAGGDTPIAWLWNLSNLSAPPIKLVGHAANLKSLAFDPQSNWLATGGIDENIFLWNLRSGDPAKDAHELSGHSGDVSALAFSPDGHWLASGSLDSTVRLWNLQSMDYTSRVLKGHTRNVNTLAFSPDGTWLATGSFDHAVLIWNLRSQDPEVKPIALTAHADIISALAFSPGGRWLATGSADHTVRLWDMENTDPGINSLILRGHTDAVTSVAFSPGGNWLVSGSADHSIRLWDMTASDPTEQAGILRAHDDQIASLAFSPDGLWLVSGSRDNSSRLWSMAGAKPADNPLILRGHSDSINALALSTDGHWLASGSADNTIKLWDVKSSFPPILDSTLRKHTGSVDTMAISPDNRWLATGGQDAEMLLWDLNSTDQSKNPIGFHGDGKPISKLAFSPDMHWLAAGSVNGNVQLWEYKAGSWATTSKNLGTDADHEVTALVFDPASKWLAVSSGFNIRLWNLGNVDVAPISLSGHENRVICLAISPDGSWLASGGMDNAIRLWNLKSNNPGANPIVLTGHSDWVNALAFSPKSGQDGASTWLASGSKDKTALLWDLSDFHKAALVLRGHDDEVTQVAFSPDGHWLVTAGNDRTLRLWNLQTAIPESNSVVLRGHTEEITALVFLSGGEWLLSASKDQTMRLWRLDLEKLKSLACETAGRNLTRLEWGQYFPGLIYESTCSQWPAEK